VCEPVCVCVCVSSGKVATFTCDSCGFEIYQEVGYQRQFTPIADCPSSTCSINNSSGKLFLQTRGSKFTKYQVIYSLTHSLTHFYTLSLAISCAHSYTRRRTYSLLLYTHSHTFICLFSPTNQSTHTLTLIRVRIHIVIYE